MTFWEYKRVSTQGEGREIETLETKNPERESLSGLIALIDPATTYFPTTEGSIIGAKELDDRVRNGIGYGLFAVITGFIKNL